jgi:hypothetical protein
MPDEKLENLVSEYAKLAKEDKNIDTAALLMNALQQADENHISQSKKRWAYLVCLGLPPVGYLFALSFYFSDKTDGKQTAYICIALTTISLLFTIILFKSFFSSAGVSPEQIQQIKLQDIQQLTQ